MADKKQPMCDIHQEDIIKIKKDIEHLNKDFNQHKIDINKRFDDFELEIFEKMKPPISKWQMITLIITLATPLSVSVGYVNENRQDIRVLQNNDINAEKKQETDNNRLEKKVDKIYDLLLEDAKRK